MRLVALGAPFGGTPVIDTGRGALMAAQPLLGAIRVFAAGGLDAVTRLAGYVIGLGLPVGFYQWRSTRTS